MLCAASCVLYRVAALKRHLEYDHKLQQDSDPFIESAQTSGTDDEREDAAKGEREEEDPPAQKKPRTRRSTGLGDKPHVCEICGNKFKEVVTYCQLQSNLWNLAYERG